jgi:imidazoleglycerol phosphate dehydratase HisB
MNVRTATVERLTRETRIQATLTLDGSSQVDVHTGLGFLDHMLTALATHARFDLHLRAEGDLHIDDHHTAEDTAIVLGQALREALGDRRGVQRFGSAYAPLDEALVRAVVDLSGRPWPEIHLGWSRERLGDVATENLTHFFETLAMSAQCNLHVDLLRGRNDHHKAEAAFKATALALRAAVSRAGHSQVPSTKGVLQ